MNKKTTTILCILYSLAALCFFACALLQFYSDQTVAGGCYLASGVCFSGLFGAHLGRYISIKNEEKAKKSSNDADSSENVTKDAKK